jgi:hypothetical protein
MEMEMKEKEAVITLFTYLVMCNEKAGNYGLENHYSPGIFAEFYYENSVTESMMRLMVDEDAVIKSACKTVIKKFDPKMRRYLFAELVRFVFCFSNRIDQALRLIYSNLELHDRSYEKIIEDLCGEPVAEFE